MARILTQPTRGMLAEENERMVGYKKGELQSRGEGCALNLNHSLLFSLI